MDGPKQRASALGRELAELWSANPLDVPRLEALESRFIDTLVEGTQVMREALTQAHEILDPAQRRKVTDWLQRHHRRHPCSCAAHC